MFTEIVFEFVSICICDCLFAFLQAEKEPGVTVMEVQGYQTMDCSLVFSPTQVGFWTNIFQNRDSRYSMMKTEQTILNAIVQSYLRNRNSANVSQMAYFKLQSFGKMF